MRLIDADALIHAIRNRTAGIIFRGEQTMLTGKDSCNPAEWTRGYEQGVMDTVNVMGSQNIIEVDPVRHGWWNVEYPTGSDFGRCSACKTLGNLDWHYCPNCGAKMVANRVEMHTVKQGTDGESHDQA